jgi:hypothetical protein
VKKNLLLALVAVMALGQSAHAAKGTEKDGKTDAVKAAEVKKARDESAKSARGGADSAGHEAVNAKSVEMALGFRLSPDQAHDLGVNLGNPVLAKSVQTAMTQAKSTDASLQKLGRARLESLLSVKSDPKNVKLDALATEDVKAELAFDVLATSAAEAAIGWSKDLRDNLTSLLETANGLIVQGRSKADAMIEAKKLLAQNKRVTLNFDDVNKWCP